MRSGKAYVVLLVAGFSLVGFYMSFSELKPVSSKRTKIQARYKSAHTQAADEYRYYNNTKDGWDQADSSLERLRVQKPANQSIKVSQMDPANLDREPAAQTKPLSPASRKYVIEQRVKSLYEQCQNLSEKGMDFSNIDRSKLDHIIVNDEYKVLYCYVPKVACTNMKRMFLILTGMMNTSDPLKLQSADVHDDYDKYLTYMDSLSVDEITYRLAKYRKVIFVRDPLERMLSAYRNKFLQKGNSYFKEKFGRKIIKKFRKNPSEESLELGNDVTFNEFVHYLLYPKTIEAGYNEHWATFTELCHPCHLHYNFIGKHETLDEDVGYLLDELGLSDKIRFPERGDSYRTVKTEDTLQQYYQQIKLEHIRELMTMYGDDYELFDYEFPDSILKLLGIVK